MSYSSTCFVSNVHCPSCVSHVHEILSPLAGIDAVDVSLIEHTIHFNHNGNETREKAVRELINAAFEIEHVVTHNPQGVETYNVDLTRNPTTRANRRWSPRASRAQRKHIENCRACQREREGKTGLATGWTPWRGIGASEKKKALSERTASISPNPVVAGNPAVISIDGAQDEEREALRTAALSSSTDPDLPGPKNEDAGACRVILNIEGMTCASCVVAITNGLQELPFVKDVSVTLMSNSGMVTVSDQHKVAELLEKISDLGYEATIFDVTPLHPNQSIDTKQRSVQIQVDGMFCGHCPENVIEAIQTALQPTSSGESVYSITKAPSLKSPVITVSYKPSPQLSIRSFISAIDNSHDAFKAKVYHPPTMEKRSRDLQRKERRNILRRLLFTTAVAIPSFIIGIVYMNLVPASNKTRLWFEEPIIVGNVMRLEWALFFLTTPIMFFGSDIFHKRALKEIRSMWRPSSKVPLLRRFYRFGSMDLLISAGTSVAYFSSVAILGMNATNDSMTNNLHRASTTYFDSVTFLTFFLLIGRYLEAYSKAKTGDAVALLSNLRPSEAFLIEVDTQNSTLQQRGRIIPVDQLEIGDVVQIPHGSSPPTDGVVDQEGSFIFDESSLTGESKPVNKVFGDPVFTGSVNISNPIKVKVTEVEGSSMLDRIVAVVREGQAKRAPIERVADFITGYFVPVITLIAISTWCIWLGLGQAGKLPEAWLDVPQGGWPFWSLEFAIAVFVVACPCGIGLAAPTALFVGSGLAAKSGILVQGGGEAFQESSKLDIVVFDKTGTLTQGKMQVTEFEKLTATSSNEGEVSEAIILAMSTALEEASTHPIAKAVSDYSKQKSSGVILETVEIKELPGLGMKGIFTVQDSSNTRYEAAIGHEGFIQSLHDAPVSTKDTNGSSSGSGGQSLVPGNHFYLRPLLQKHQSLGRSTAIFASRKMGNDSDKDAETSTAPFQPLAVFAISDPVRPEATSVLRSLDAEGVQVHMCTGDNRTTALAIASQLGIPASNVRAGVLPNEKAAYIRELQGLTSNTPSSQRRIVAFVGDGTNDSPALSAADASIALSSGSDVAVTTASFILLNSDLSTIVTLVRLARRVFLRVKLNFAWAAVYNLCLVPVAAGIFFPIGATNSHGGWRLGPVWASVAMACSSVSVVLSSLALKLPEIRSRRA